MTIIDLMFLVSSSLMIPTSMMRVFLLQIPLLTETERGNSTKQSSSTEELKNGDHRHNPTIMNLILLDFSTTRTCRSEIYRYLLILIMKQKIHISTLNSCISLSFPLMAGPIIILFFVQICRYGDGTLTPCPCKHQ